MTPNFSRILRGITPQSVLKGMSKRNLKHSKKHLLEFQKLDPSLTEDLLRKLGASIVKPENFLSNPGSSQKVFEQVIKIGKNLVTVRVALNEKNKLHSIHIKHK